MYYAEDAPILDAEFHYLVLMDTAKRKRVLAFHFSSTGGFTTMYTRTLFQGAWMNEKWSKLSDNFLPLTGGMLSGNDLWFGGGKNCKFFIDGLDRIGLYSQNDNDPNNRRTVKLSNLTAYPLAKAIQLEDKVDGANKAYNIYGEHNKPSGSYTGNGSATSRTVAINSIYGVTALLQVNTQNMIGFFGAFGGVMWQTSDTTNPTVTYFTNQEAKYDGTNFTLATTNKLLNNSGWTYQYRAL